MFSGIFRRSLHLTAKSFAKTLPSVQFEYKLIEPNRYGEVVKHLENFFCVDEPLSKATGLLVAGGNSDLEAYILNTLEEKLSIMAVTEDDKIAGVALNGYFHKNDKARFDEMVASCKTDNFRKILRLLFDVNLPIDLFSKFSVDTILDARMLSVDTQYRQHKLGRELMRNCEPLYKKTGFKVIKGETTGEFSYRLLKKLGFEIINEIVYDQYLDASAKPVLMVEPPHKSVKLVYKLMK